MIAGFARPFSPTIEATLIVRTKPAAIWEQGLVSLWILLTFTTFPGDEFFLYPCALAFLTLFILYRDITIPVAMRAWILTLFPILGTLSVGWSPAPAEAFRTGAMLILNFIIMITIASRLNRRQILHCVFFAGIVALAIAAPNISTFAQGGIYGSKNFFAIRMLIVMMAGLAVALDSEERWLLRLVAIPVAGVAFIFLLLAKSATSLVFAVVGSAAMIAFWAVWQPASRIRHMRSFVLCLGAVIAVIGAALLLTLPDTSRLFDDFLRMLGKDATLTNRTIMWEAGLRVAEERPWFGLGLDGFWRYETGLAQTLNELDYKEFGTKLSFHNSYIEMKVTLGIVGLVILISALTWAFSRTIYNWFVSRGMASSFFLIMASVILISTFTESLMMGVFDTCVLLFYLAALTGLAEKYHQGQKVKVRLRPQPD